MNGEEYIDNDDKYYHYKKFIEVDKPKFKMFGKIYQEMEKTNSENLDYYYDGLNSSLIYEIYKILSKYKFDIFNDILGWICDNSRQMKICFEKLLGLIILHSNNQKDMKDVKFNKFTIYLLSLYLDNKDIQNLLFDISYVDREELYQVGIDTAFDFTIKNLLDTRKLSHEDLQHILQLNMTKTQYNIILDKFIDQQIYPTNEQILKCIEEGLPLQNKFYDHYKIDIYDVEYISKQIIGKTFNVKNFDKLKVFNDSDKNKLKSVIIMNADIYNPKQLDDMFNILNILYDQECIDFYCQYGKSPKIYKHIISKGYKPSYDAIKYLIKKSPGIKTLQKFIE